MKRKILSGILLLVTVVMSSLCGVGCSTEHTHSFGKWTTVTQPTCTQLGVRLRTCECGETQERELPIDPTAHTFGSWQTTLEPTCSTQGVEVSTCACGQRLERNIPINADGHTFGEWMVLVPAGCSKTGKEVRVCDCGHSEERNIEMTSGAHNFSDWTVVLQPTCSTLGKEERRCDCGEKEERSLNKLPHTFSNEWTKNDVDHWHKATCCNTPEIRDRSPHSFGNWTVEVPATCSSKGREVRSCICGQTEQRETAVDPNNHAEGEVEHLRYTMKNSRTGAETDYTTVVNIVKWADRFTVQFDCKNSQMYSATSGYNTALYNGDVCEIFITVGSDTSTYYEIEVAPNNSVFFMKIKNNGSLQSTPQVNTLTTEIIKNDDGYTAKMTIPYSSVEYDLDSGAYFNAYRIETDGGEKNKHLLAVSPTLCDTFHTPSSFIKI